MGIGAGGGSGAVVAGRRGDYADPDCAAAGRLSQQLLSAGGAGSEMVVRRLVHHIEGVFGPGKQEKPCGHPQVEMALV
jgi:hypothetical protein